MQETFHQRKLQVQRLYISETPFFAENLLPQEAPLETGPYMFSRAYSCPIENIISLFSWVRFTVSYIPGLSFTSLFCLSLTWCFPGTKVSLFHSHTSLLSSHNYGQQDRCWYIQYFFLFWFSLQNRSGFFFFILNAVKFHKCMSYR